jgi:bidirectional [NiFe] hydrogenase diaphorase subunit
MTMKDKADGRPPHDERYKAIDRTVKRFNCRQDALLEVLNTAQETFGYLPEEVLSYVARQLRVPLSRVYGVATFYHMFTFEPLGEHTCIVCAGTACHVKGADYIIQALSEGFNVRPGATTADGMFSLIAARCLGCCGLAPVVVLDGQVHGKETPEGVLARVRDIIALAEITQQGAR